jgi:hypothetical protein
MDTPLTLSNPADHSGVQPALTTIYHGGVKAAGFRIPTEMTAALTEDLQSEDMG